MEHVKVKSSNIESVAYDPATRKMQVTFKSSPNEPYEADGVAPFEHEEFIKAESLGSHFSKHLKPHFTFKKINQKGK